MAWRGVAWRGVAGRGVAWRGVAGRGVAWRGVAWCGVVCVTITRKVEQYLLLPCQLLRLHHRHRAVPVLTGRCPLLPRCCTGPRCPSFIPKLSCVWVTVIRER